MCGDPTGQCERGECASAPVLYNRLKHRHLGSSLLSSLSLPIHRPSLRGHKGVQKRFTPSQKTKHVIDTSVLMTCRLIATGPSTAESLLTNAKTAYESSTRAWTNTNSQSKDQTRYRHVNIDS